MNGAPLTRARLGSDLIGVYLNSASGELLLLANGAFRRVQLRSHTEPVFVRRLLPVRELMCSLESSLLRPCSSVMWLMGTLRLRLSSSDGCNNNTPA